MRILVAISLIVLTLACAHRDAGKGLSKLSSRKPGAGPGLLNASDEDALFDSTIYMGYVDYFPETREFYTAVFFRDGHEYPDEDLMESKLDSVIVFDDDWGRERLPMEEARRMLVLSGLDTLSVFNRRHERICECPLKRVEFLWNGIESYFIAVFGYENESFAQTEELYGVSSRLEMNNPSPAEEIRDEKLDRYMRKKLKIGSTIDCDMRHYRLSSCEQIFSVVSSYSVATNESNAYLTLLENDSVRVLNHEVNSFHFLNILPLPVSFNGKPLLLISAGYPSSDVLWDYLAAFDSATYQPVEYNRVPFHAFGNQVSY